MHILGSSGAWTTSFLDPWLRPDSTRVHVVRQVALFSADQQYFVRKRDPRMVLAYALAFGPKRVWRKISSRQSESTRNDAWLSVGLGWVEAGEPGEAGDGSDGAGSGAGRRGVVFVVTSGPRGSERLVAHRDLVVPVDEASNGTTLAGLLDAPSVHAVAASDAEVRRLLGATTTDELAALAGWQPEEGAEPEISGGAWRAIAELLGGDLRAVGAGAVEPRPPASPVRERFESVAAAAGGRPEYHVFGYGQYAKVNAIANLDERLHLAGVHEINPLQLGPVAEAPEGGPSLDTSPWPRDGEKIANAVVAGYHHTHVPTVVALLDAGARHVIIEKPIASSADQVDELMAAMGRHPDARVHCAFQRSYSPFNTLLRRDLGDAPTSMAAVVYEVPLPPRHWYRWPVVGNAVVSNGCHWIDYFLHMNGRPEVVELGAVALPDQTVLNIELVTGASASISLRHRGSPRLGVRDTIQFWTEEATATIEDNAWYRSESGYGRRRSSKVHRSRATEEMYKEFGRLIADDLPGDDPAAIGRSARTVVELAALVDRARSARTTGPAG